MNHGTMFRLMFGRTTATQGAHLAHCMRIVRTRDPYFVILGASLLFEKVLMLLSHWGYGISGFSTSFAHFHPFSHLLLISHHIHCFLG